MIRRLLITAVALTFAACASQPPADASSSSKASSSTSSDSKSRYGDDTGDSPVGVIPNAVIHDSARNKDLEMSIEYPTRGAAHPLIVFSHGFGGSSRGYVGLSSYWASNGYVVIKPSHADAGRATSLREGIESFEDETPSDWRERVRDVTLVLDSLGALEQKYPELQGKIDHAKIGVGGHSYGAFTSMLVGGARTFPGPVSYADPRVKAIIAMSPQGPTARQGLTTESWRNVTIPALYMTGTKDRGVGETDTPEWREQAYELSPPGDKWLIVVANARHMSFTGLFERIDPTKERTPSMYDPNRDPYDPRLPEGGQPGMRQGTPLMTRERSIFAAIRMLSLAFWDTYLRGDAAGRQLLDSASSRGDVEAKKK